MVEEKVTGDEEGAPEIQRHYLRLLIGRLLPDGLQRPRVAKCPNCSSVEEATFLRVLKILFILILTWAVISLIRFERLVRHLGPQNSPSTWDYLFHRTWLFGHFQLGQKGIVLLAVFAAAVGVGVFVKKKTRMKSAGSTARVEHVQTISARLQQV